MTGTLAQFSSAELTAIIIAIVTIGIPSTIGAIAALRNRWDMKTRNGKTAGQTIHDAAQTVEVVQAQQHAAVGEFEQVHGRLGRIEEKVDRINGRVDRVEVKLDKHLAEVGEGSGQLAAWVREQMDKGEQ